VLWIADAVAVAERKPEVLADLRQMVQLVGRLIVAKQVAAIGMRFYTGRMFPEKYRGGVFIAEHGSWNRSTPIGYRVSFVKIENGRATSYEPFAAGWLKGSSASGRPADVLVMPDGALLVSDDKAGRIYRITHTGS